LGPRLRRLAPSAAGSDGGEKKPPVQPHTRPSAPSPPSSARAPRREGHRAPHLDAAAAAASFGTRPTHSYVQSMGARSADRRRGGGGGGPPPPLADLRRAWARGQRAEGAEEGEEGEEEKEEEG
ncbi:unnamed protein product, partial [Prorocentrum cordatum]